MTDNPWMPEQRRRLLALREAKRLLSTDYYSPPIGDLIRLAAYICTAARS